ncbi:MAG: hypothetical protein QMC95_13535 [Desulfitobacteriaceae bacterium]|nr:hypothetical protein [Desulfitobacteriaceae bacterium]MDI6915220.1 hypothetical protein [Desulfitobacteriaceae bacterium]
MDLSVITKKEALQKIVKASVSGELLTESHLRDVIIAEYLRKSLCNLTSSLGQKSQLQPIYVTRLLNSVRRQLSPLWPELNFGLEEDLSDTINLQSNGDISSYSVRRVLDSLETVGDAVEVGNGYWLPTPMRLVQPPVQDKVLVVGGLATADLSMMLGINIKISGFARHIERSALPENIIRDESWWQSYEDWVGDIPGNLCDWTKSVLDQARLALRPSASNFDNFEVYVPSRRAGTIQFFRWVSLSKLKQIIDMPSHDLMLCRFKSKRPHSTSSNFWLGIVDFDGLKKEAPVFAPNVRRLMYGLDLLNGAPTHVVWKLDGIIDLRSRLPHEELRLAMAIGVDVSPRPGRLPIRFMFQPEWQDTVTCALNRLGVNVDGEERE